MCYGYDGEGALRRSLAERGMSRRSVLRGALFGTAGAAALATAGPAAAGRGARPPVRPVPRGKISIQLWTVRDALWGEPGLRLDPHVHRGDGLPARRAGARLLRSYGGRAAGLLRQHRHPGDVVHDGISATPAALETKLDNAKTLGQKYVVVPYLDLNHPPGADWQRWADQMNAEAAVARGYGLRYGYHNHAHEFTHDVGGGQVPWDVLTSELDPKLVHLEADLYWVVTGGINSGAGVADPEQFAIDTIEAAPQKVRQYHVKDRHEADGDMADLGTGMIDFARIFAAHTVEEYIVENDTPDVSPLQTAEVGYSYLRNLRF